jgi:beta-1,2-mannobiose phosphorylase / 1,2-beta-oligomannan phosphorylase
MAFDSESHPVGAPPVATEAGLLLFYHEHNSDPQYTIKVALLDDETGRVESLLPEPILLPELPWERSGDVDDVVFVQGAVPRPDGTIYLTYGAADRCISRCNTRSNSSGALPRPGSSRDQ